MNRGPKCNKSTIGFYNCGSKNYLQKRKKIITFLNYSYLIFMSWLGFQVIHFKLAELQTEIELLRAGIYQATDSFLEGQ